MFWIDPDYVLDRSGLKWLSLVTCDQVTDLRHIMRVHSMHAKTMRP